MLLHFPDFLSQGAYFPCLPLCKYRLNREVVQLYDSKSCIENIYTNIYVNKLRNHLIQLGHHLQLKFTASRNTFAVKLFF